MFLDILVDFSVLQWISSESKYWVGRSMSDTRMTLPLLMKNVSTIPIVNFLFFFSSLLIKTTSPNSIFISFALCIMLYLSRRDLFPSFLCCIFTLVYITLKSFISGVFYRFGYSTKFLCKEKFLLALAWLVLTFLLL